MGVDSAAQMTAVITVAGTKTTEGLAGRVAETDSTEIGAGKTIIDRSAAAACRSAAFVYAQQYLHAYQLYGHFLYLPMVHRGTAELHL